MKKLINTAFLSIVCLVSFTQVKQNLAKLKLDTVGILFFFDEVQINEEILSFIDVNKIADVKITKASTGLRENYQGRVDITSKNPEDFNFLSFGDIERKYVNAINKPILLLVNGNVIKNTKEFKIDNNHIYKVKIEHGKDFDELKSIYPDLVIVDIRTKNSSQLKEETQIMLRGMPERSEPL
jgi:hypothetical protein